MIDHLYVKNIILYFLVVTLSLFPASRTIIVVYLRCDVSTDKCLFVPKRIRDRLCLRLKEKLIKLCVVLII